MNKVVKSTVVYVLVAIVGLFLLAKALTASPGREKVDTLEFSKLLDDHQVATAKLYDRDHVIRGELKDGKKFEVKFPDRYTDEITDMVVKAGVHIPVANQKDSVWVTLLSNFAPFVLIIPVIAFFMNQAQGGGNRVMSFGKARPKIVNKDTPKVTNFVGAQRPQEVTPPQIDDLRKSIVEGAVKPKPRVSFEAGDEIRVIDGARAMLASWGMMALDAVKVFSRKTRMMVIMSIIGVMLRSLMMPWWISP